jgi:hypothetical protein
MDVVRELLIESGGLGEFAFGNFGRIHRGHIALCAGLTKIKRT